MHAVQKAAARWALGLQSVSGLVALAENTLAAGHGGEATVLIAGMSDPLDRDVRPYVSRFFDEQGCAVPSEAVAAKALVDEVVAALLTGRHPVIDAATEIVQVRVALEQTGQRQLSVLAEQLDPFEMTFAISAGDDWPDQTLETALLRDVERFAGAGGFRIG